MAKTGIAGDIVHSVGVRYRFRGAGLFRTRLYNMGGITSTENTLIFQDLDGLSLQQKMAKEKTAIANFEDQGIQIYFRTTHIDEVFIVSKITCFVKPVAESYPIRSGG